VTDASATQLLLLLAIATLIGVTLINAPYGRHDRAGWGPRVPARLGWVLMEAPAFFGALAFFLWHEPRGIVPWVFMGLWATHYGYRELVFPCLMRDRGKTMPLLIPVLGVSFNVLNAWLNMRWISALGTYETPWLLDPRFGIGLTLFVTGFLVHVRSDAILRALRVPGSRDYAVPHGFLYRFVSCPNYLGEMIQWTGWAILTWSLPGLAFALYTMANLGPRAGAHHRWYRTTFTDYPPDRRALIPGIW